MATPLISGTGKAIRTSNLGDIIIYLAIPNKNPLKILDKNGAWSNPGTLQFFWVPPIISGTGKATDFKFGEYIYMANTNKNP